MGANRTTFEKLQRDRAKKAKAAAKRARRQGAAEPGMTDLDTPDAAPTDEWDVGASAEPLSAAELLVLVEQLQNQFDAKAISFEEYEERKSDLLARIPVD